MPKTPIAIAESLLDEEIGGLEEVRVHEFEDDETAHDDEATEKLYADFRKQFTAVESALTAKYGKPSRVGNEDDDAIPLNGVFRFAIWQLDDRQLYAAAAHEDRGTPILLLLGTAEAE